MPLYFAYGSNMDRAAMVVRCPASTSLGPARLARHRPIVTAHGYAPVVRDPRRTVWGFCRTSSSPTCRPSIATRTSPAAST